MIKDLIFNQTDLHFRLLCINIKLIYMYNVMNIIIIVNSNSTKTQKQWYTLIFIWYVEHVILILGEIAR